MPASYSRKSYLQNTYYHVYNRGVEKRAIFLDRQDYSMFLSYLAEYLLPKDTKTLTAIIENLKASPQDKFTARRTLRMNNFAQELTLACYCLMPNHFHLLIKQQTPTSIDKLMNSLGTRYTMYFNKKYKRVGSLYQGVYKAAPINNKSDCLGLTRYIHNQSSKTQPSSYEDYVGKKTTPWVSTTDMMSVLATTSPGLSYEAFLQQEKPPVTFPTFEPQEH